MTIRLVECRKGDRVRIVKLEAGRSAALHLVHLGLDVGQTVEIRQRSPLRGPLLVAHDGTEVAIGYGLAEKILVEKE